MSGNKAVNVGSRSSELAMIQSRTVVAALEKLHPTVTFKIITMKTIGDKVLDKALPNIGQTNLFTKELEVALAAGEVDLIVHSLKDLPTALPSGMHVAAVFKRDNPTDALVLHPKHKGKSLEQLPAGSVIGTSSLRRIAQLKRNLPGIECKTVRGNLNTRLSKLDNSGEYDALVLATSGLERMGWKERISQELDPTVYLYAVGQGALAVETRTDDDATNALVAPLNHLDTLTCCSAERNFLNVLGGGCSVPVATSSAILHGDLLIQGKVYSLDGSKEVSAEVTRGLPELCSIESCSQFGSSVGDELAHLLIEKGAKPILEEAKQETDASVAGSKN